MKKQIPSSSHCPASVTAVYTACDGSVSLGFETTGAPCATDRPGPMFIAYYDYTSEVIVTVGDESQTVPIRMGEMTALKFKLPKPVFHYSMIAILNTLLF